MSAEPTAEGLSVIQDGITTGLDIAEILATMSAADRRIDPSALQWLAEQLTHALARANQAASDMELTAQPPLTA